MKEINMTVAMIFYVTGKFAVKLEALGNHGPMVLNKQNLYDNGYGYRDN